MRAPSILADLLDARTLDIAGAAAHDPEYIAAIAVQLDQARGAEAHQQIVALCVHGDGVDVEIVGVGRLRVSGERRVIVIVDRSFVELRVVYRLPVQQHLTGLLLLDDVVDHWDALPLE